MPLACAAEAIDFNRQILPILSDACFHCHGPDAATFEKASSADLSRPDVITGTMAFMFETRAVIQPTRQAMDSLHRQRDYQDCWKGLKRNFNG